jgi:hypothetical protein
LEQKDNRGLLALVFGVLGIVTCQLFAPAAAYIGYAARRDAIARGEEPDGMATAGMVLGIVGTLLFALALVLVVVYFVFVFLVVGASVASGM